jgi:Ca2+-binding RTX toxin-like protein
MAEEERPVAGGLGWLGIGSSMCVGTKVRRSCRVGTGEARFVLENASVERARLGPDAHRLSREEWELMKSIIVFVGSAAVFSLVAACSVSTESGEETVNSDAIKLSSPVDPVAFCRASGLNVIIGTQSNDTLTGTAQADCIVGLGAQDTITGGLGDDLIFAGEGEDVVRGGDGNDQLFGGGGQDQLFGDAGNDSLNGELGDDVLSGGVGNDTLSGGLGQDRLQGDAGNDTLAGEGGDDQLQGGDGNDALSDCTNHNVLNGNAGTNTCQGSASGINSSSFANCQTITSCP